MKSLHFKTLSLLILLNSPVSAQNLVQNGDLEIGPIVDNKSQISRANGWTRQCSSPQGNVFEGTPDLLDCKAQKSSVSVPLNDFTSGLAERDGDCRYAHIFQNKNPVDYFSEVITGSLTRKLEAGNYDFSMWMAKAKSAKNVNNKLEIYLANNTCVDGPLIFSSGNVQNPGWVNGKSSFTITSSQANIYDHIRARLVKVATVDHEQDMLVDEFSIRRPPIENLGCLRTTGTVLYVGTSNGQPEARSHHCEDDEVFAFLDINGGTLDHNDKINIRSYHNNFFHADSSGALNVNTNITADTKFTIQKVNNVGTILPNTVVTLKTDFNKFISANSGGGEILSANRDVASWWERFQFLPATEKIFCLKTYNGQHYVSSEKDLVTVNANRTACKEWEKHTIIDVNGGDIESGDYVFVRSHHSRYWSAQPSGELEANRNAHGPWERFEIFKIKSANTLIKAGDQVGFRGAHNKWLSADNGGGNKIKINRNNRATWETFTLEQ